MQPWCWCYGHWQAWGIKSNHHRHTMTEQHKASPEQWAQIESYAATDLNDDYAACLLDIRARVEALENAENDRRFKACMDAIDAATPEQIRAVTPPAAADAGDSEYTDAEWAEIQRWKKTNDTTSAPASSLVERVASRLNAACGLQSGQWDEAAIDVIRAVAAHIRANVSPGPSFAAGVAAWLEQEAER